MPGGVAARGEATRLQSAALCVAERHGAMRSGWLLAGLSGRLNQTAAGARTYTLYPASAFQWDIVLLA